MSDLNQETIQEVLAGLVDPVTQQPIMDAAKLANCGIADDKVMVEVVLGYPAAGHQSQLIDLIKQALEAHDAISQAAVDVRWEVVAHKVQDELTPIPGVKNVLAIASGKGGVGKSTTAANLALALAAEGARVGLLDADIYGPSQPKMMGLSGKPDSPDGQTIDPKVNHGIQTMSIGYLIEEDTPMVWRGPMVTQALQQLLNETNWSALDYLIIDMPPGTGDIQLTLAQRIPVSGALIVTTPQDIALLDARKGLKMFEKVDVPVLGIIENMATHICSQCGHEEHIFGAGGGEKMAEEYDVALLGSLPLDIAIREQTDAGAPTVVASPDSAITQTYKNIATKAAAALARQARNKNVAFPKIVIQNT